MPVVLAFATGSYFHSHKCLGVVNQLYVLSILACLHFLLTYDSIMVSGFRGPHGSNSTQITVLWVGDSTEIWVRRICGPGGGNSLGPWFLTSGPLVVFRGVRTGMEVARVGGAWVPLPSP